MTEFLLRYYDREPSRIGAMMAMHWLATMSTYPPLHHKFWWEPRVTPELLGELMRTHEHTKGPEVICF